MVVLGEAVAYLAVAVLLFVLYVWTNRDARIRRRRRRALARERAALRRIQ